MTRPAHAGDLVPTRDGHGLKRVGYCETQVEELKWLPKGHTTGYGAGWKAKRPTRVAILPVCWYNGFGCEMGNDLFRFRDCLRRIAASLRVMLFGKAYYVTINGKRCKVLGHIGMLHTAADVSGIQCSLGDMVRVEINPLMQGMQSDILQNFHRVCALRSGMTEELIRRANLRP